LCLALFLATAQESFAQESDSSPPTDGESKEAKPESRKRRNNKSKAENKGEGKSDSATKSESSGKSEADGKSDSAVKPDSSGKADASAKAETQSVSSSAKGQIKGIVDGKPRFDCKEFTDIAVGQKFVVEGKTPGQLAATIEVIQVAKNRRTAAAKVLKLEPEFELNELLNLAVIREKDFNLRYSESSLAGFVAPDVIVGRNNMFGIQLNLLNYTSPAPNLITGVALNQGSIALGPSLEFFFPSSLAGGALNKLGFQLTYLQSIPLTIVGRVGSSDEVQTLKVTSSDLKFGVLYRSKALSKSLSNYWTSLGYEILDSKAKIDTNVGSGNTSIGFQQKGLELGLGGDFSPLPFFYLGADLLSGLPQKYSGTDSSNTAARSGSWNQFKLGAYGELRYPVGRLKTNILSIQIKAGASVDQIEVPKNGVTSKETLTAPLFGLRLGFFSG